ncbi:hypothetical protein [Pararhizobium sp. IMCC21322]|uniref:hypothetical protein n=1 Tax=Pararhizobium sp. IMCC21322 TaxID=3067903 RepID=UPI0027421823|nr:hypothetical protein [Pararhizobium sp. IMCC21322]
MRWKFIGIAAAGALMLVTGGLALSMDSHQDHADHADLRATASNLPSEGGQSAFVAIAEIVALLSDDPQTDWSKVNISALRAHLVDMSELTLEAEAEQVMQSDRVEFSIRGEGKTLRAIQAMVPAHASELDKMARWAVSARTTDDGALLIVTPENKDDLEMVSALGFFGLMATGAHHQPHHLAMAKGTLHGH